MSDKQNEIHKENLIQEYRELLDRWNGKDEKMEEKIQDIAGELEDLGINVEDLK